MSGPSSRGSGAPVPHGRWRAVVGGLSSLVFLGWLVAASGAGAVATATSDGSAQEYRLAGEFGLAVHEVGDSMVVRWMTEESEEGHLEVSTAGGDVVHQASTDPWTAHRVAFATPDTDSIQLAYGALSAPDDARHRTWIHRTERKPRPVQVSGVDSLFVMADIHGEYDGMVAILRNAGLIDEELRWTGGRSHLVALGDMLSRGPDATPVLWFLYRLEREAAASGGRVHVLLGNHEIMVMLADLRYVHEREMWLATSYEVSYDRLFDPRQSILGRWLAEAPAILRVDDVLLSHGGISTDHVDYTLQSHRDTLAAYMAEDLFYRWGDTTAFFNIDSVTFNRRVDFFWDDRSVFWYRGYSDSDTLGAELGQVLDHFDSRVHVMGHTPVPGLREVYDGRMVLANPMPLGDEILLLTRSGDGWDRVRIGREGPPQPLKRGLPESDGPPGPDGSLP